MVAEFAMQSISAMANVLQILKTISDSTADTNVKIGLSSVMDQLLNAQKSASEAYAANAELVQRAHELEAENVRLKNWEVERRRYAMHELKPGITVYRIKPEEQMAEPDHVICAHCYSMNQKSILQSIAGESRTKLAYCPSCKTSLDLSRSLGGLV